MASQKYEYAENRIVTVRVSAVHTLVTGTAPARSRQVGNCGEPAGAMAQSDVPALVAVVLSRIDAKPAASRRRRGSGPLALSPAPSSQSAPGQEGRLH